MQAVILGAGASTRFYPLSEGRPKCLIPLMGKPILAWTIEALGKLAIKKIVLVNTGDSQIKDYFGDGKKFGVEITYVTQDKPLGMGDALLTAKDYLQEEFFLLNAHHLDIDNFSQLMIEKKREADAVLLAEEKENFWEFGVLDLKDDQALKLMEKPPKNQEFSRTCVVGIYLLTKDFLPVLAKTPRDQYQFEIALDQFMKLKKVKVVKTKLKPVSLKYPWDLLKVKDYLLEKMPHQISRGAKIGKGVILVGKMKIEDGVTIHENAVIKGPVYLGKNVLVGNNALIRDGAILEENARVGAFSEIKNSLFLPGATLGSGFVASSIIGENCRLAHNFTTANRRFDRKVIKVKIKEKEVETGLDDFGVLLGENVYTGIGVGTMPGITIGKNAVIGPGTFVFDDVLPGTKYFTEFKNKQVK